MAALLLALLGAAFVFGCRPRQDSAPTAAPPRVTVSQPVVQEHVDEDEYTGWLRASATVDIRSRVRGHIKRVHFRDGDFVKQGQLLFELDPDPFLASIEETKAEVSALEAQRVAAEKSHLRNVALRRSGAVSLEDVDQSEAEVNALAAAIRSREQTVYRYELDLKYSRITSPIDGRIGRAQLTEGNFVNAGGSDPVLATIVATSPVYVYFTVDERSLQRYQKMAREKGTDRGPVLRERKMPFRFALDSDHDFPHSGLLDFADNTVDSATGTIEIRGTVDNPHGQFVPGSRVRVRVPIGDPYRAVLVPDTALLSDQDKRYVLVVGGKNIVSRRDVTPGRLLDNGMRMILPEGPDGSTSIRPEEWIIVEGLQRARINYPVEPVKPSTVSSARSSENYQVSDAAA